VPLQEAGRCREGHSERVQVPVAPGSRLLAAGDMPSEDEGVEKTKRSVAESAAEERMDGTLAA
jgi:hypothetical protein